MEIVRVPVADLQPDADNARQGDVRQIIESLKEFGQHRPLVVQRKTGRIIAGNHTYHAAVALGWTEIDVLFVDDDDRQAIRRAIADNATGDLASWNDAKLRELLEEVGTDVPGLTQEQIDELMAEQEELFDDGPEETPIFPIVANAGEHYAYVLVVALNAVDAAWLETNMDLRTEQSYKSSAVGHSRVVTVPRFRKMLPELGDAARNAMDEEE